MNARGMMFAKLVISAGIACGLGGGAAVALLDDVKVAREVPAMHDIKSPGAPSSGAPSLDEAQLEAIREAERARLLAEHGASATHGRDDGAKVAPQPAAHHPSIPLFDGPIDPFVNQQRVFTDQMPDGTIWVRGRNYKAAFDTGGLSFIPFLGSDAPRNFPVQFRLEQVMIDDLTMSPDPSNLPAPELDDAGTEVRFIHAMGDNSATLVETYTLDLESIEQKFLIAERPHAASESQSGLVVHVAVETELDPSEDADSIRFSHERGHVNYTHAVLIDAQGRQTPLSTRLSGTQRIVIEVPADVLDEQVFPIVIDPFVSFFSGLVGALNSREPDVAYDLTTNRYIIVGEFPFSASDGDIWAELRTASGALVAGSFAWIDITTADWRRPRVANNRIASQFLVVAQVGTSAPRNIWGRTRQATGAMGSQFAIIENSFDKINPDVGGDPHPAPPTYYCVVWQRVWNSTDHDIHASLVTTAGAVHTLPGGTVTILIDNTFEHDRFPAISKSNGNPPSTTQEWTIVWQRTAGIFNENIWGAQVHWNGSITHGPFPISTGSSLDARPSVSSLLDDPLPGSPGARPYLVTFQRGLVNRTVQGRVFQGASQIASANLTALEGAGVGQDHTDSHVDSDGKTFIVAYAELFGSSSTDYDAYVASFCLDGTSLVCTEPHQNLVNALNAERQLRVAANRSSGATNNRAAVVWTKEGIITTPFGDVQGALYDSVACCLGDFDGNGSVGVGDLLILLGAWGPNPGHIADLDGNGSVGVADLLILLGAWGPCP